MKFYKTTIVMEVLSDSLGIPVPEMEILDLAEQVVEGFGYMDTRWDVTEHKEITKEQLIKECEKQGTDPAFFLGDEYEEIT